MLWTPSEGIDEPRLRDYAFGNGVDAAYVISSLAGRTCIETHMPTLAIVLCMRAGCSRPGELQQDHRKGLHEKLS